jgi:protein involved in polysaccharide export with SLBB domain
MKYLAIGLFSLFSILSFAFSQITGLPTLEEGLKLKDEASYKLQQQSTQQFNKFPVSNFVEDRYYFIGPNDALSVLNIPSSMNPEILMVSPEGKVIIPRVGLVDLKGLSLPKRK